MIRREIILLNGSSDAEGNRLLDRLEQHTGVIGEPQPSEGSRLYHLPVDAHEDAEPWVSEVFENQLEEPHWRDSLRVGVEGAP